MARKKVDLARQALNHALKINPHSEFFISCSLFHSENGYLTPRQIEALNNIKPPLERVYRRRPYDLWDPSTWDECPNGMFGDNPFDPDR